MVPCWIAGWLLAVSSNALAVTVQDPVAGEDSSPYVLVLGVAQDAGYPQAGCQKQCCQPAWSDPAKRRFPTSVAIVDPVSSQRWLLDCSWQLPDQWRMLNDVAPRDDSPGLDGILLTHAHIGHYTGLMHLGREVMGARLVPVHAMPRMRAFLEKNGPWDLLVKLENIQVRPLEAGQIVELNPRISVVPIGVPHRGEYSETVGFVIKTPGRSMLYLPDIDKWSRWETEIETVLQSVDVAFLDATFFANGEIPGRDMSLIPHPFVSESLNRFQPLPASERDKIHLIHFNHTNPILDADGPAARQVRQAGLHLAEQGKRYSLGK